ncbi:hypothetical protein SeW_A3319 [Salmonella enterica subsp. enterica serovar Weltevreden str. HI_N05-537]|nr:hypothetical protein SeW_A3319 [Salmonella enterica subsp. enterica serovar Weltevreden str. HI_N05-537]
MGKKNVIREKWMGYRKNANMWGKRGMSVYRDIRDDSLSV